MVLANRLRTKVDEKVRTVSGNDTQALTEMGKGMTLIPTWYRELWIRGSSVMLLIHMCNSAIKCSRTLSTGGCINSTWF